MTKQEQIKEMTEKMQRCFEKNGLLNFKWFAEALYNAGYRKIDALKAENKQLKTECALLDDELRIARQETIDVLNKVKERAVGLAAIETYHICNLIDELLKEYE